MLHVMVALVSLVLPPPAVASASLTLTAPGDAVVTLTVNDSQLPAVTALDLEVDGDVRTTILLIGYVGHPPA